MFFFLISRAMLHNNDTMIKLVQEENLQFRFKEVLMFLFSRHAREENVTINITEHDVWLCLYFHFVKITSLLDVLRSASSLKPRSISVWCHRAHYGTPIYRSEKVLSRAQNSDEVDLRRAFNLNCQKCAGHLQILNFFFFFKVSRTSQAYIWGKWKYH